MSGRREDAEAHPLHPETPSSSSRGLLPGLHTSIQEAWKGDPPWGEGGRPARTPSPGVKPGLPLVLSEENGLGPDLASPLPGIGVAAPHLHPSTWASSFRAGAGWGRSGEGTVSLFPTGPPHPRPPQHGPQDPMPLAWWDWRGPLPL